MTRSQLIILGAVGFVFLFVILLLAGILPGLRTENVNRAELTFFGLKSDEAAMQDMIAKYSLLHKNVTIKYTGIPEADYENVLIDRLAAGTGPDIFLLRNDWIQKHKNKVYPAPAELVDPAKVEELFPQVVGQDLVMKGGVWGLPLSIDTLALVYNRSIFDLKQIPVPPSSWEGIKAIIPKLRELKSGALVKGGVAMGSTDTHIMNATDILTALLMQSGAGMVNSDGTRASFANGVKGLLFYTDFASPANPAYAWDDKLGNSIDAFANGSLAMNFLYYKQLKDVRARNPLLRVGVLPLPQFNPDAPANIARFWSLSVSNRTQQYAVAWDFVNFAATDPDVASAYASLTGSPPALRSLISQFGQTPELKVFSPQALLARDWPVPDDARVRKAFNDVIESTLKDKASADRALRTAEDEITRLIVR